MDRNKLKTVLLWVAYIVVCLLSAAMPLAERGIRRNLIGKEEHNNGCDNTVYYRRHADYRGI